jgi:hypothetical protein
MLGHIARLMRRVPAPGRQPRKVAAILRDKGWTGEISQVLSRGHQADGARPSSPGAGRHRAGSPGGHRAGGAAGGLVEARAHQARAGRGMI